MASAASPHIVRTSRWWRPLRLFTRYALKPSTVNASFDASVARNASSSVGGSPLKSCAAAVSWPAMCATTSRFHQPAHGLGSSQLSGGAYWIVRPSR